MGYQNCNNCEARMQSCTNYICDLCDDFYCNECMYIHKCEKRDELEKEFNNYKFIKFINYILSFFK
jgi:hypothetical protein